MVDYFYLTIERIKWSSLKKKKSQLFKSNKSVFNPESRKKINIIH